MSERGVFARGEGVTIPASASEGTALGAAESEERILRWSGRPSFKTRTCGIQAMGRFLFGFLRGIEKNRVDVGAGDRVGQGVRQRGGVPGSSLDEPLRARRSGRPAHLAGEEPVPGGVSLPWPRCLPWGLTFHFLPLPG